MSSAVRDFVDFVYRVRSVLVRGLRPRDVLGIQHTSAVPLPCQRLRLRRL